MFIHNYSHTFFLLLRGPISQVVLHDCRQRDVSQTLMSIHGWVRGFRMCKTSSLQLLLGQLGTSVGSHPSEELENVHWLRGAWNQQHGSIFPWFRCLMWKAWFVVGCSHWYYTLQWHIHLISSEQRAKLLLHFEWRYADSWLWEWYESDSFAWNNESSFFLIGLRCTHCTFEDLHNAEAEAELVSFEVSICLFWNNYYLLYCPVKSDILSFHFHNHLSDRSFALLSRAMVASCQARPSVRIVLMMEEGKPKQTTCHASFPR